MANTVARSSIQWNRYKSLFVQITPNKLHLPKDGWAFQIRNTTTIRITSNLLLRMTVFNWINVHQTMAKIKNLKCLNVCTICLIVLTKRSENTFSKKKREKKKLARVKENLSFLNNEYSFVFFSQIIQETDNHKPLVVLVSTISNQKGEYTIRYWCWRRTGIKKNRYYSLSYIYNNWTGVVV